MDEFEKAWRDKISKNTFTYGNSKTLDLIEEIDEADQLLFSKKIIEIFEIELSNENTKEIFLKSACHMPHANLETAKAIYQKTNNLESARLALLESFKKGIKEAKNLSLKQLDDIIEKGFGTAGVMKDSKIIATKLPSLFHEYFKASDDMKKYYYCHCPRVREDLLKDSSLSSIYCNCGGGFYQDIWEYITSKKVKIKVLKNLFDNDEVCSFEISITNENII